MHLSVHDGFEPGDEVLLQRVERDEFTTVARQTVARAATSVTFASIEPDDHWHITIRRGGKEKSGG